MKALEDLRAARALLQRSRWTQGAYARDANGDRCMPNGADAAQFCAIGALLRVQGLVFPGETERTQAYRALRRAAHAVALSTNDVVEWNDVPRRLKSDVIDLYNTAIADVKSRTKKARTP